MSKIIKNKISEEINGILSNKSFNRMPACSHAREKMMQEYE